MSYTKVFTCKERALFFSCNCDSFQPPMKLLKQWCAFKTEVKYETTFFCKISCFSVSSWYLLVCARMVQCFTWFLTPIGVAQRGSNVHVIECSAYWNLCAEFRSAFMMRQSFLKVSLDVSDWFCHKKGDDSEAIFPISTNFGWAAAVNQIFWVDKVKKHGLLIEEVRWRRHASSLRSESLLYGW